MERRGASYRKWDRDTTILVELRYIKEKLDAVDEKVTRQNGRVFNLEKQANQLQGAIATTQLGLKIVGVVGSIGGLSVALIGLLGRLPSLPF